MLRRHLLMAGTAIALTAVMVGAALGRATLVVSHRRGRPRARRSGIENYIKNIEAGVKAMDGTEIDLQIVPIAASSYADKLSALLLGGDIPDLIYFQGGDQKMVGAGHPRRPQPADRQHQVPRRTSSTATTSSASKNYPYLVYNFPPRAPQPVIRTDWLEKLGGKKPETVDEYTALFQAIHDGDLDGDGTAGNTLGLTAYVNTNELDDIFNQAFGVTGTWMKDASRRVGALARDRCQEKAKIAYYAELAAKGLFDKEYVTNKFDVKEDKFYTGKAGVIFGSSAETVGIYGGKMAAAHPGENITLTLLPVPKGPAGQGLPGRGREQGKPWLGHLVGRSGGNPGSGHEGDGLPRAAPRARWSTAWALKARTTPRPPTAPMTVTARHERPGMPASPTRPTATPPVEWRSQASLDFLASVNK